MREDEPVVPIEPEIGFMPLDGPQEGLRLHPKLAQLDREKNYDEVIGRRGDLLANLKQLDGLAVLGVSGFYTHLWSLQSSLQKKPEYELQVADLEFLQLLVLQSCPAPAARIPTPDDFQPLWEETRLQYFSEVERETLDLLDESKAQLAQRLRMHSAYYRNPYGVDFFRRMFPSICEMLDSRTPSNDRYRSFSELIIAIIDTIDQRIEHTREQIAEIHAPDTELTAIAERLSRRCAQAQELYSTQFTPELSREELQVLCHNMLELSLWLVFRFTEGDIAAINHRKGYDSGSDLAHCSIEFSEGVELSSTDIWSRPFVAHGGDFYLFSPYTTLSFPFHLLLSVDGRTDSSFKSRLEKTRGQYLEAEASDLFRRAFPSATIVANAYWYAASGDRIETDLLIKFGNRLIVAESKGAILPDKLRNGNYLRARTFLRDTFGAGNLQAHRFAERLMAIPELDLHDERGEKIASLRGSEVSEIIPIVLTIEQLGIIANARKLLEVADVSGAVLFSAMPMMVAELAYILKLLPDEITRVHYLSRRSRVYQERDVLGDEMDLFTLYVMYGYSADFLSGQNFVWALGASYSLSNYLDDSGALKLPPSSTATNTPYFSQVSDRVVESQRPDFLEVCLTILDLPSEIQQDFEQALRRVRLGAAGSHRRREHCEVVVKSGIASVVLLGTSYRAIGTKEKALAQNKLLEEAISRARVKEGILIDVYKPTLGGLFSCLIYRRSES